MNIKRRSESYIVTSLQGWLSWDERHEEQSTRMTCLEIVQLPTSAGLGSWQSWPPASLGHTLLTGKQQALNKDL